MFLPKLAINLFDRHVTSIVNFYDFFATKTIKTIALKFSRTHINTLSLQAILQKVHISTIFISKPNFPLEIKTFSL